MSAVQVTWVSCRGMEDQDIQQQYQITHEHSLSPVVGSIKGLTLCHFSRFRKHFFYVTVLAITLVYTKM